MTHRASATASLRTEAWLTLSDPAMSMAQGRAELEALGNTILEEDLAGRRFKVCDQTQPLSPEELAAIEGAL